MWTSWPKVSAQSFSVASIAAAPDEVNVTYQRSSPSAQTMPSSITNPCSPSSTA